MRPGHHEGTAIARVTIGVRSLTAVSEFYVHALGLSVLYKGSQHADLGVGGRSLLRLVTDPQAQTWSRRMPGLFHTAFLMPDRAALGAWLVDAPAAQSALIGAADHLVSEALYLQDPEGNGIEVYADRHPAGWPVGADGQIDMPSLPLDLGALAGAARSGWTVAPADMRIGHVHLQVSNLGTAEQTLVGHLGMQVMYRYPGAVFLGWNGYHHQIAVNVWNSRNAPTPQGAVTGLREIVLSRSPAVAPSIGGIQILDEENAQ